jgi:hypothetical protein
MVRVHSSQIVQRAVIGLQAPAQNFDESARQGKEIAALVDSIAKRPDAGAKNPSTLAGIPDTESVYFVGHASPAGFARFNAATLFEGLKATNLAKTYRGKIILVGCETGVRRHWGYGASLAGQLAALLSADGYKCSVIGMTGFTFVLESGEIRIHNNPAGYQRAVTDWRRRAADWSQRELKARTEGFVTHTAESFAKEKQSLFTELDTIKTQHSKALSSGSIEVRSSDSRYGYAALHVGALASAGLAWYYREQLGSMLSTT